MSSLIDLPQKLGLASRLKIGVWASLSAVLLLVLGVFWPGLSGGFVFDDYPNLVSNERLAAVTTLSPADLIGASLSSDSGPLKRPLSMLSFALNHAFSGMDPFAFKITNVLIHVFAGVGVFAFTAALLRSPACKLLTWRPDLNASGIALLVSALWLLHPLQLTSVLYVVQRMASLASLFMIWGMAAYAIGRLRQIDGRQGMNWLLSAYLVFLPLSALSKENGVLLPLFLALIELLLFRLKGLAAWRRGFVISLHFFCAVAPVVFGGLYLLIEPNWILNSYSNRDFTLSERLLTQARALWFYFSLIAVPDITRMGLYHDDFIVSTSWLQPLSTVPAVIGIFSLIAASLFWIRRYPIFGFCVFFFLIGHALESSFFGLEMLHEHRNYLSSFGPILGLVVSANWLGGYFPRVKEGLRIGSISLVLLFFLLLALRSGYWGNDLDRALFDAKNHPDSPRSRIDAGLQLLRLAENHPHQVKLMEDALEHFEHAAKHDSYTANAHFAVLVLRHRLGKEVEAEFVERIAARLRAPPMASSTPTALMRFIQCQSAGSCRFEMDMVMMLVRAATENPRLSMRDKSQIFTEVVQLFLNRKEPQIALFFAASAVSARPEQVQLRLNLAATLIEVGRIDDAMLELENAECKDHDGFYFNRIAGLRAQIERAKKSGE